MNFVLLKDSDMKQTLILTLLSLIMGTSLACAQSGTNTIHLTSQQFKEKVADYTKNEWKYLGDKPAIVDFYADWCGPCKAISPILEELAAENPDIVIYKVNVDKQKEVSAAFGIRSIPTLIWIPLNGQPQISQGAMGKSDLQKAIDSVLKDKEVTAK